MAEQNVDKCYPFDLITHGLTNSKRAQKKLIEDIRKNGIKNTIKYVKKHDKKYVVDGHHRLYAAKKLGLKEVPIEKVELPYLGYQTSYDMDFFNNL